MNGSLLIYVLTMGGLVLPDTVDTTPPLQEDMTQSPVYVPRVEVEHPTANINRTYSPTLDNRSRPGSLGTREPLRRGGFGAAPGQGQLATMPTEPTNLTTGPGGGIPSAPTAGGEGFSLGSGPVGGRGMVTMPNMPTSPDLTGPRGGSPGSQPMSGNTMRPPASFGAGMPLQNLNDRPFQGYKPAPTVSPWQNLYRTGTNGGTIDNYNSIVRPQLDQGSTNQHVSAQIGGLQNTQDAMLQQQRAALQGRGQEVPTGTGLVNPSNYINYKNYYPGLNAPPAGPSGPYGP